MGGSIHGRYPQLAGWFHGNPIVRNGWWLGVSLWLRKPPHLFYYHKMCNRLEIDDVVLSRSVCWVPRQNSWTLEYQISHQDLKESAKTSETHKRGISENHIKSGPTIGFILFEMPRLDWLFFNLWYLFIPLSTIISGYESPLMNVKYILTIGCSESLMPNYPRAKYPIKIPLKIP